MPDVPPKIDSLSRSSRCHGLLHSGYFRPDEHTAQLLHLRWPESNGIHMIYMNSHYCELDDLQSVATCSGHYKRATAPREVFDCCAADALTCLKCS